MFSRNDLVGIAREIIGASPFALTEVQASSSHHVLTRYGANHISQNVDRELTLVRIRAIDGKRTARIECDKFDHGSVRTAYARLKAIMDHIPSSVESDPMRGPGDAYPSQQDLPPPIDPESAASFVTQATKAGSSAGLDASGALSVHRERTALANSMGLEVSQEIGDCAFACTIEGGGGAGRGFSHAFNPASLDVAGAVAKALEKCMTSTDPASCPPGMYDVVLEPAAVSELVFLFGASGLSAKAYVEDRSFCRGKLGKEILDQRVSLVDDPSDPMIAGYAFDGAGVAKRKLAMIRDGVLETLASDLRTSMRWGKPPSGHGSPEPDFGDPVPWNLCLEWGGPKAPIEELISKVKRGIFVTQLHYVNVVDRMAPSFTGMTRNGTFLIENGVIVRPILNLRFIQSMVDFFNSIEAVSEKRERISSWLGLSAIQPAVLARNFHFTSSTEF